jgi:uncharacterized repeat protein (TIGR02543 family)
MYSAGTEVRLTAEPAGGKVFDSWSGDATGSTTPLTVTVDTDLSITANFADWCYLLNLSVNPTGTGTVDAFPPPNCEGAPGESRYTPGTQVQLTARPAGSFRYWSGHLAGNFNPAIVTLDADKSIVANFGLRAYLPLLLRDG